MSAERQLTRRAFVKAAALGAGSLALAACATPIASTGPSGAAATTTASPAPAVKGKASPGPAQATVTGVVQSKPRIILRFKQVITYRYTDRLGGAHDGKSGYLSPGEAAGWRGRQGARQLRKTKP